jgi:hypothetical protein
LLFAEIHKRDPAGTSLSSLPEYTVYPFLSSRTHKAVPDKAPALTSETGGKATRSDTDAAAIRTAFEQGGELSAAVNLRRLFPGISDNTEGPRVRPDDCRLAAATG